MPGVAAVTIASQSRIKKRRRHGGISENIEIR
jgi:hypothetical protein